MMNKILILILLLSNSIYATDYYVSTSGSNSNDGTNESKAWRTISYAASRVEAGDTVWIKSGNYGNEKVTIKNNGRADRLISFIGYINSPGDISSMYYSYKKGRTLDSREMPLLDGGNRNSNVGILLTGKDFVLIKNIQIKNYQKGIFGSGSNHNKIENVLAHTFGSAEKDGGRGIHLRGEFNKILNCTVINSTAVNVTIYGDNNLIEGVHTHCDESLEAGRMASTDYYITIQGSRNIIRDCFIERVGDLRHNGHGISLKSKGVRTEDNLVENCTIVNVKGAIEARHRMVRNNIFKNLLILGWNTPSQNGGIVIHDGASYNTFERIKISGTNEAFRWYETIEDEGVQENGHDNIFKNIIVENVGILVVVAALNVTPEKKATGNSFVNCTFNNIENMFQGYRVFDDTNSFENCIFNNVKKYNNKQDWTESHNNYYQVGFTPPKDNNNLSKNPQFEDLTKGNYKLKSSSSLINAGLNNGAVTNDYDGNGRPNGGSHDIGAYEYNNKSTGSIKADAGNDETICKGEYAVLTASGGNDYSWSNGQTTKSIKVSPEETTIYSVRVSDGVSSDTDQVKVTVNNVIANAGTDVTINENESVKLTASGGDSYLWSNGKTTSSITVSPSNSKIFTVVVTKNGCQDEDQVFVEVKSIESIPPVNADAGEDQMICKGEQVTLTARGGSSYIWNTGQLSQSITISPSETTVYSVSVSDGNTSDTDEVKVTVNNVIANAGPDLTIDSGESVKITASGGDRYKWSNGETSASITINPTTNITYTVIAYKNGCEDLDEVKISINDEEIVLEDEDIEEDNLTSEVQAASSSVSMDIRIYPNPSSGQLHVQLNQNLESDANLTVIDGKGGIMYDGFLNKSQNNLETKIDLTGVDKGIYFVRLMTLSESVVKKLIVI